MKTNLKHLLLTLALLASIHQAAAQAPIISSFSQNGLLVCANLQTGTVASVEWASSLSGPWQTNWAGLDTVTVNTNGTISVSVPMFYRVRGVAQSNNPTFTADGMALIPAGSFTMGNLIINGSTITNDPDLTDAIPTNVTVSAFYMDTNLVSYSKWQSVYNWATTNGYGFYNTGSGSAAYPVYGANWYDCVKWCNARSQQTALTPVYYTDMGLTQIYTNGEVPVYANWSANGYRLPTEAEWEKAARGGLTGQRFPWGNYISETNANYNGTIAGYDSGPPGPNANYSGGSPGTSPVGSFAPNGYGLYDMSGNLFSWCWDWYGTPYGQPTTNNPTGPASGTNRLLRGGSYHDGAIYARCAGIRNYDDPHNNSNHGSFRCVRKQ